MLRPVEPTMISCEYFYRGDSNPDEAIQFGDIVKEAVLEYKK